ncbi:nuclear apoptosis-inducing factor 1-like protein [Labeo rohita]|uniref:Nuclear apoptosis-inducing factor 1-like protein n=1 Tax=Labeo rohita TaxID=84645 RepID=A0A498NN27_LABRO|nr:nuclear apoptosis-inducing factor 1-like protein [Labeo rohita]
MCWSVVTSRQRCHNELKTNTALLRSFQTISFSISLLKDCGGFQLLRSRGSTRSKELETIPCPDDGYSPDYLLSVTPCLTLSLSQDHQGLKHHLQCQVHAEFDHRLLQVKKKWADLKLSTKKRLAALKRSTTQTGGGQPDPRFVLTPTEERVSALIGPESIVGISVGGDTDEHVSIHEEGM